MQNEKAFTKWLKKYPKIDMLHSFFTVVHISHRVMGKKVKDTGVYKSQHRMLMMIYWKPNITQVKIAEKLEVSPACVATMLKKLEKGGYIERKSDENDTRANKIVLTQKGNDIVLQSKEIFCDMAETMFKDFSDEEQKQLDYLIGKMTKNLKESEDAVE